MNASNSDRAYEKLHELIANGELAPGARIMEAEIAARIGLSRTPVREAIRKLESNGLIVHKPRSGAAVRKLEHQEIVELYEMRIVLERAAAFMAARHISIGELQLLSALNKEMLDATDTRKSAECNIAFHLAMFSAARNRFLVESYGTLADVLLLLGPTTLAKAERVEAAYSEHLEIIEAIKNGDSNAAANAIEQHMNSSLTERLKAIL
ncbi:MAG: GntR family transcriptional regulator [Alphaproteobacteria bacterium]